ncbi:MAG: OsmC family protein [Methyloceanibacter sp.]
MATSVRGRSFRWSKWLRNALSGRSPPLRSAPPTDFDGPGDAWSPEHLLLAAVETCVMFTFRAIAQASKFDFLSLDLSGSGTVDRKDGATRFTEIILKPRLTLPKDADPERARRMLEKGKKACLVTESLSVSVRLGPKS